MVDSDAIVRKYFNCDIGALCESTAPYPNTTTSPAIVHAMTSRYPLTFHGEF